MSFAVDFARKNWHNFIMHNWDYPKNKNTGKNEKWFLERLLTYGFGGEKIRPVPQ